MTPSGTVLCLLRQREYKFAAAHPYLGVAPWAEGDRRPWVVRAVSSESSPGGWPPLPESRREVESIGAMMPAPPKYLFAPQATTEDFKKLHPEEFRVLHLAMHAVVDPVFPDKSALVFLPSKHNDGHLEAREIRLLRLHAALVTLSACSSSAGPVGADGVESVDTAFIEAGASTVVSAFWELEDHATSRLMGSSLA